jgi:glycosyltransferase involved in cell wall biosynthesis
MTAGAAPEPLRVLFLARSYPNNVIDTLGTWTAWLARELSKHCDVRVISPVPWCPPLPRLRRLRQYTRFRDVTREELRDGIRVYHPRFAVGPGQTTLCVEHRTYERAVVPLVDRLHEESPFDLIHAHFIYADGVVASRLARRYGVPFVVTDQAPWIPWLERKCVRRVAVPAARDAARLACVSGYLRDTVRHYLGPEPAVDVIPNGVDPDTFAPRNGTARDRDQIAYVGLINVNKGIDTLLHAMTRVAERNPNARLVLVGGSYYRNTRLQEERLKALARELALDGRVTFAGRLPPEDVARFMRESAVVVLPSRAETFGAVLVEALASGTPVVATASGGPQEIVTDEVGRIVPTDDPEALADALLNVMAEGDRFDPQGLREYALSRYSWSRIAGTYLELYANVLGRGTVAA